MVEKSTFAGGRELGLFAARHFQPGSIITAYAGVPAKVKSRKGDDDKRKVKLVGQNLVNVPLTPNGNRVLFSGDIIVTVPTGT